MSPYAIAIPICAATSLIAGGLKRRIDYPCFERGWYMGTEHASLFAIPVLAWLWGHS